MNRHAGFTLLEAVVALLIISVGLLGIIVLQAQAMDTSVQAARLTLADMAALDIANRIQANPHPQAVPIYSNISSQGPSPATRDCRISDCDPSALARFDVAQWQAMLDQASPHLAGMTRCLQQENSPHGGCQRYQVTLFWPAHSQQAGTSTTCPQETAQLSTKGDMACHSLEFEP